MNASAAPVPTPRGKIWQKLALSLLPVAAIVWLMKSGSLPILPKDGEFARVVPGTIPLMFAFWFASYLLRLVRWYWLLAAVQRVPLRTVMRVCSVGLLAIALLPFRMGEVVRPLLIRRAPKLSFWAASGTIGGERIIDAFFVSALLLLGLHLATPLEKLPDHIGSLPIHVEIVPRAALVFSLLFATACVVMGIFYLWRSWAQRTTELLVGIVSKKLAHFLATKIGQMAEGLGFLANARQAVPYLLVTLSYWLLNAASFWALARGCGFGSIGFWGAVTVMGVVGLGILLPATPGFFGAFQVAMYAGLAMYLPPETVTEAGSVYAFIGYALPIGMTTVMGLIALLTKPSALLLLTGDDPPENLPVQATAR